MISPASGTIVKVKESLIKEDEDLSLSPFQVAKPEPKPETKPETKPKPGTTATAGKATGKATGKAGKKTNFGPGTKTADRTTSRKAISRKQSVQSPKHASSTAVGMGPARVTDESSAGLLDFDAASRP